MSLMTVALEYAERGFKVIPLYDTFKNECVCLSTLDCRSPGKHPRLMKGLLNATDDPDTIEGWWKRWPTANIGIVTGEKSGISVIDLDGPAGAKSFEEILSNQLPKTKSHKTPKGFHLIYKYNPSVPTGAAFLPGVDARNNGGYIVAPPSKVFGKSYSVIDEDVEIASLEIIPPEFFSRSRVTKENINQDSVHWFAAALRDGANTGERNVTATRMAGWLHGRAIPDEIIEVIMADFSAKCDPPFNDHEMRTIVRSVSRYKNNEDALNNYKGDDSEFRL